MKIGLIGMSGTGKTTIIENINNKTSNKIIVLPEVARGFLSQENMFSNGGYELNIQSICVANWNNLLIMNQNPDFDFISDRTIVDDFALMHLYFNKTIDTEIVQANIDKINANNNSEFLYDTLFVIENNTDRNFVESRILSDSQRKNSKSYEKHIDNAVKFYALVDTFLSTFKGVAKNVIYVPFGELRSADIHAIR